jgi:hypothetical protein
MRKLLCLTLTFLLTTTMAPFGFAHSPFALTATPPDALYFENQGELYKIDFESFRANSGAYGAGRGSFTIEMRRVVFRDSPPSHELVPGDAPRSNYPILGSKASHVRSILGRDLDDAVREEKTLSIHAVRRDGRTAARISTSTDSLSLSVHEEMLSDDASSRTGTLEINGSRAAVSSSDLKHFLAVANGSESPLSAELRVSAPIRELASRMNDGVQFNQAVAAYNAVAFEMERAGSVSPARWNNCEVSCVGCVAGLTGYFVSWGALFVSGCGALVGCWLWGVSHTAAVVGGGTSCGECIACRHKVGPAPSPECPVDCDWTCPEGCPCSDGSIAGPNGCECDPNIDPGGCECPLDLGCIDDQWP